ncbi:MAG: riboflavin biosynthesis protein RibF [Phycisphaerales bacterium]|nr:riboflavin biosynthesis protein RibF [Phycisphaerales bacterium]
MQGGTAITIGNFDGVHRAHAELVRTARQAVGPTGRVVVMTFEPHPIAILRPDMAPERLSTTAERRRRLEAAGADAVIQVTTTRELLSMTAEAFLEDVLMRHAPDVVVEGPDFHFGRGRSGTVETLRAFGADHGFETIVLEPVEVALSDQTIVTVSSSMVRWLLKYGRVGDAAVLLDGPFTLVGTVVKGDQRGRTIGFPTANLDPAGVMLPADGIYAGFAERSDGRRYPAAISVVTKPTFGQSPRTCEAHLLSYDGPLDEYGWTIRLEFHRWLRAQVTYGDVEALVAQLHRDVRRTGALMHAGAVDSL